MPTPSYQQVAPFHFSKNYFRFIFCFFWSYWRDLNPRRPSHCFLVFRFVFSNQISPYERVLSFPAHIPYVQGPHSINRSLPFIFQKNYFFLIFYFFGATGGIRTRDGVRTAFLFFDLSFQAKSHLAKECSLSPHISPMCRVPILSTGRSLSFFKKTISALYSVFWSYWRDSNPRPVDYESTALAD